MLVFSKTHPLQQIYIVVQARTEKKTPIQQIPAPPPWLWLPLVRKNRLLRQAGQSIPVPVTVLSTMSLLTMPLTILPCLLRLHLHLLWFRLVRRLGNRLLLVLGRCLRGRSLGLVFVGYKGRDFSAIYHYSFCYYYYCSCSSHGLAVHCKGAWELDRVAMSAFAFAWLGRI